MSKEYTENDLKCCGNCKYRRDLDMGDYYEEYCMKKKHTSSSQYCPEWEYDGLRKEEL